MTVAALTCDGVAVRFGPATILHGIDLVVAPGELVAVLGPSGSGKTTLLHVIAGFIPLAAGSISIGGRLVADAETSLPPESRSVGVVFQHHALWPHMTATETISFPLQGRDNPTGEALGILESLGIGHLGDRRPDELSGGEQQRVSLGRALARHPAVFLLDEPTAHLDAPLRAALLEEIRGQRSREQAATVYATHDPAEALAIADRLVLLRSGTTVQAGTPRHVYEEPVDRWAAELTGPVSQLDATVGALGDGWASLETPEGAFDVPCTGDGEVALVRPEWVALNGQRVGTVEHLAYRGSRTDYRLATDVGSLLVSEPGSPGRAVGDEVPWTLQRLHLVSHR